MLLDYKTKRIRELNKRQVSDMKEKVRLALKDIESRYDLKHKESLRIAIEGGVNVNSIEIALRNLLKSNSEDPFYHSNSISLSSLLHYNGESRPIKNLINNYGIYFSEFIKSTNVGINIDTSNLDYIIQLKAKKLESMGISPEKLIH